jgi:ADP-heptose:LPS heptosyltransferase
MDQTRTPIGEAAIEFVVRKRPGAPTPMAELKQEPASIIPGHMTYIKKKMIALHRPGAIGDIIMTLSLVPLLKKKYPNRLIHYFCNPVIGNSLAGLMQAAGVDQGLDCAGLEQYALKNNYEKVINLIGYPLHEGYPEKPMRKHLIEYFADEMGLDKYTEAVDFVLELSHLTLSKPPRPEGLPARYATIHPYAGWSVYKNWSKEKWEQVIADRPDIPFYQIGSKDDPRINGADHTFMGQILYNSIALMANAELHIGVDSWTNHLTNIEWENPDGHKWFTPAVILWGSTQWTAAGYDRNHNISLNLPCQPCFREDPEISRMPRGPCINPPGQDYDHPRHACMAGISVEAVLEAIEGIWPA